MSPANTPQLFHCPTCGAALPVPDSASVRCEYCGSSVLVPAEYRPEAARSSSAARPARSLDADEPQVMIQPPVVIEVNTEPARRGRLGCAVLAFILLTVLIGAAISLVGFFTTAASISGPVGLALTEAAGGPRPQNTAVPDQPRETAAPAATAIPPVVIDLKFGSQGTGPGQFDDARYAVVDPDGNIFVADYQDGRLQKFDPSGKFLQLINVEPDRNGNIIIRDLAADYRGQLYVVRGGDILVYKAADGTLAGRIPGQFPNVTYDKVALDPANNLYALNTGAASRLELIKFSPEGQVIWRDASAAAEQLPQNKPSRVDWISVDGTGNIYLMDAYGGQVLKFSTDGKFIDRFGSKGEAAAELNSPGEMAVDPTNRIFILDNLDGIVLKVFDANGSFLGYYPWPRELAYPRKLSFDLQGSLYTVTGESEVVRLHFNEMSR